MLNLLVSAVLAVAPTINDGGWGGKHHRHHHRHPKPPPMQTALASWYDLDGAGACGYGAQAGLRFASLILGCGQRIRICHSGCVTATMADRGPYVSGRTFDLNVNLRNAIGCSDLCTVRWRLAR